MLPFSLARPLYDTADGGPPRAWECLVCPHSLDDKVRVQWSGHLGKTNRYPGRVVLASEKGMRLHLVKTHHCVFQGNLFIGYRSDLAPAAPKRENGSSTG